MPVAVEQPCFDPGDMGCEPLAMPEGNELVLPAVQQQHGNGDIGQLESSRADVGAGVVPPSLAARRESLMIAVRQEFSHLLVQHGRVGRRQEGSERLRQLAGRRGQDLLPVLVYPGARRLRVGDQQLVGSDIVFFHAREPVEPLGRVGRIRCERRGSRNKVGKQRRAGQQVGPAARDAPRRQPVDLQCRADCPDVTRAVGDAMPRVRRRAAIPGPVVADKPQARWAASATLGPYR